MPWMPTGDGLDYVCDLRCLGGNVLKARAEREPQSSCTGGVEGPSLPTQTCPLHPCGFSPTSFDSTLKEGENLHSDVSNLMQEDLILQEITFQLLHLGARGLYLMWTLSKHRHEHKRVSMHPSLVDIQPAGTRFGYLSAKCYAKENTDSWHQVYPRGEEICEDPLTAVHLGYREVAHGFLLSFYFHCVI